MLVQLIWKSNESRNLVGSNWNELMKKPPSRQCRDVLRLLKFNAAKAPQQGYSSTSHIAEKSSDTVSQELPTAASTSTTTVLLVITACHVSPLVIIPSVHAQGVKQSVLSLCICSHWHENHQILRSRHLSDS